MKQRLNTIFLFLLMLLMQEAPAQSRDDAKSWFEESRFGMFIHWGLYSAAEGMWKGEPLRYLNNYAEWIQYRNRISKEEYGMLAKRFDWNRIHPEEWVVAAKNAGMKYIIMTTKHHDGVAIWDSKVDGYTLPRLADNHRDIIQELAEACRKHDMKLGFYYSHWIDWGHPYAWSHNQELQGRVTNAEFDQYWQQKVIPQLTELLSNYGDIAMMWFDMWIPYQESIIQESQLVQVAQLIRKLQPNCLINSRLGLPAESSYVDFETLGDNQFGEAIVDHPWETPGTIAHSWGYNGQELEWKSTSQLLRSLLANTSLGGGLTLNIGPRANGDVPYESERRLDELGDWLSHYGESVYGTTGIFNEAQQPDWGRVSKKKEENVVYLQVFNWPLDRVLRFSGIPVAPQRVELLSPEGNVSLHSNSNGPLLHVYLPERPTDNYCSVIRVVYDDIITEAALVPESTFGGFSLGATNFEQNLEESRRVKVLKYDGKNPTHAIMGQSALSWKVYFPEAGRYKVDLSAHNPSAVPVPLSVFADGQQLDMDVYPSSKIVVEPNENNYTEEFSDRSMGALEISKPGYYTVRLAASSDQPLWFHRLWVEKLSAHDGTLK